MGFSGAYACDCVPDTYESTDPPVSIIIHVKDVETTETIEITDHFGLSGHTVEWDRFGEFVETLSYLTGMQLEPIFVYKMPFTAVFTIDIELKSGKKLSAGTEVLKFR